MDMENYATLNSQIRQNEIAAKKKIRIRSTIITLLVVSLLLGAAFIPDIKKNSFNEGFAKGELLSEQAYADGYEDGSSAAYKEGYKDGSRATTPSVSSNGHSSNNYSYFGSAPIGSEYIGNSSSKKFHEATCSYLPSESNQVYFNTRQDAISAGYSPCGRCHP